VLQRSAVFQGFDYDLCKGCAACVEVCPTKAIAMVEEQAELAPGGVLPGTGVLAGGQG
jgi:ferredoxin